MTRPKMADRRRRRPSLEPLEGRALLASLMVTNTLDSGAGSLRQAILDADAIMTASAGAATIGFAIAGTGVHTIAPQTALPAITQSVMIDGTTQAGYAGTPLIVIRGPGATVATSGGQLASIEFGLDFEDNSDGSVAKGLAIVGFSGAGIEASTPPISVESDYIGVDPTTGLAAPNATGVVVFAGTTLPDGTGGASGTTIVDNVIGGNLGDGIDLFGPNGVAVLRNFIGTDAAGTALLGNGHDGISAAAKTVATIDNNTISNNGTAGISDASGGGLTLLNNTQANNGGSNANLTLTTSAPAVLAVAVGQTITETYTVTNNGPATATNVTVSVTSLYSSEHLPVLAPPPASPIFQITGGTSTEGTVGFSQFSPADEVATISSLASGASATLTITVQILASGSDELDASTLASESTSGTTTTTASTVVNATGKADLSVAAQAPGGLALAGVPETFTFTVTNSGTTSADALLAVQFTIAGGGTASTGVLVSQGSVTPLAAFVNGYGGDLGRLAPGASATVTAVIIPQAAGLVQAAAFAYSAFDVDPTPANNLAYAATIASAAPTFVGATILPTTGPIAAVAAYFDNAINADQAQDLRNYALTATGSTARIAIRSASYNPTTHVVTLRLARALPRSGPSLRLVVAGPGTPGILGSDARPLTNAGVPLTIGRG